MRILLGLATFAVSGAALAVWFASEPVDADLAVVTAVGAGGVAQLNGRPSERGMDAGAADSANGPRFFGSALPVTKVGAGATPNVGGDAARARSSVGGGAPGTWSTDVVIYQGAREGSADASVAPAARVLAATAPLVRERPRHELVRELQRELKRVGCYWGDVDGEWGAGSRRSMRAFMEHVNSTLQSDDPDLIQLTLVRGYQGNACRAAPGQTMAGRTPVAPPPFAPSVPTFAATASASMPANIPTNITTGSVQNMPVAPPRTLVLEGRMAVGGPMLGATQQIDPPSLAVPPSHNPSPREARPRPKYDQARRSDRNWTRNFFDR